MNLVYQGRELHENTFIFFHVIAYPKTLVIKKNVNSPISTFLLDFWTAEIYSHKKLG